MSFSGPYVADSEGSASGSSLPPGFDCASCGGREPADAFDMWRVFAAVKVGVHGSELPLALVDGMVCDRCLSAYLERLSPLVSSTVAFDVVYWAFDEGGVVRDAVVEIGWTPPAALPRQ